MNCPKCGKQNADSAIFCEGCGNKLLGYTLAANQQKIPTPTPPEPTPIQTEVAPVPNQAQQPKRNILVPLIIILALLFIIAIGVIAFLVGAVLGTNNNSPSADPPLVNPTTEAEAEVIVEEESEVFVPTHIPSTYYAVKSDATWETANSEALSDGGKLVSINSQEEFDEVCALAEEMNIKVFWVGAKRYNNQNWENVDWTDNSAMTFTNWLRNEPSYESEDGNSENYLMVFKVGDTWYFNDAKNDVSVHYPDKMGYIVESNYTSTPVYDSLSPTERTTLNTFLSNFSEAGYSEGGAYELMNFAFWHNYLNNNSNLYHSDDYSVTGMYADDVDKTLNRYFGRTIPRRTLEGEYITWEYNSGLFTESDYSLMGENTTFSVATNLYQNSNGTYTVEFNVYTCYNPSDFGQECYSLSVDKANSDYDYSYSGKALIKEKVYNGKNTYEMIYYYN